MNAFNRIIVILLILLAILAIALVVIVPKRAFDTTAGFFNWLSYGTEQLDRQNWPLFATGRVVGGGILGLAGLVLLWLELRRPRKKIIRAQKLEGGESFVTTDAIIQRVSYAVDRLPDVVKVFPTIKGYGRAGIDMDVLLETSPEIDVPMKSEEVLQVIKDVITQRMGLKVGHVQIKIKHAPYPKE